MTTEIETINMEELEFNTKQAKEVANIVELEDVIENIRANWMDFVEWLLEETAKKVLEIGTNYIKIKEDGKTICEEY